MSTWRRRGMQQLPEHRQLIEAATSPMAMWIDLRLRFEDAMQAETWSLANRFVSFAKWCISEASGHLPNDTSTAAAVAFFEHLPENRDWWPHFQKWFSAAEFAALEPVFSYHLAAGELTLLKDSYSKRKGRE